jgi:DNA repair protein RadC
MKTLAIHDRPREKLRRAGTAALGDNELLAIVIGHGFGRLGALEVANLVLEAAGGLHGLTRLSLDELRKLEGIGEAKAAQLAAAVELGRRTLLHDPRPRVQFARPRDAATYLMPMYGAQPVEQFGIVLLDTKHRVLRTKLLSVGTLDASLVHPREVFRAASSGGAAAIVLFHNHPSGDPTPSPDDIALTRRLRAAGELMGIEVIDHVILADTVYFSFREKGT